MEITDIRMNNIKFKASIHLMPHDGIENIRGDSYDDACRYKGKKRKEYELGYEEGYDAGFDDGFADSDCDSEEEE